MDALIQVASSKMAEDFDSPRYSKSPNKRCRSESSSPSPIKNHKIDDSLNHKKDLSIKVSGIAIEAISTQIKKQKEFVATLENNLVQARKSLKVLENTCSLISLNRDMLKGSVNSQDKLSKVMNKLHST
ncbi:hypothetical protein TetV_431 [Tetraselmis virus 1]|uniref:Uncharacterized protein n=1 Tax=Tetraselmis virus 1 TaxID=2060617 RepID=A0A2P0VNN2_9VIRU|nr:hypothetical protein QJ968_gp623 [Tetraselmis virus 1]AUF82513.1 hypothetical protein TetV_431 [Tetraselmis virus 1]